MFRLILLLVAGIGVAMIFADSFPQPVKKPANVSALEEKVAQPALTKPRPEIAKPAFVAVAPEPAIVQTPVVENPRPELDIETAELNPPSYLDLFQAPAVVGTDGKLQIAALQTDENVVDSSLEIEAIEAPVDEQINVWFVTGERVNVRQGPTTSAAVVDQVVFAEAVEVLGEPENGWVMIRIEGDGLEGFMANRFLQSSDPQG